MQIKKFKLEKNLTIVKYIDDKEIKDHKVKDIMGLETEDQPIESLKNALFDMGKYLKIICEENKDCIVEVTGVSFSHKNDVMGAVIIGYKKLKDSTGIVNLISPHRINHFHGDAGDKGQLMPDGMHDKLLDLIYEVERFIGGERIYKEPELEFQEEETE